MRRSFKLKQFSSKGNKKLYDKKLLGLSLLLTVLGIVAVADASAPVALSTFSDKFYFVKQQLIWGLAGIVLMFLVYKINLGAIKKFSVHIFILSIILLIAVIIPGVGSKLLGARRWIYLGPVSIQPSEIIKLSLAIYIAKIASTNRITALAYFIPVGLSAFLIMLQPDLGTAIIVVLIGLSQAFIAGISIVQLGFVGGVGVLLVSLLSYFSDYRRDRLLTFLKQTQDPLGKGYHIRQILLGLGSGGLFGVGLGKSRQKFSYLPEVATDSIFAVIAEEAGFVGAIIVVLIFVAYVYVAIRIITQTNDPYDKILSVGILSWIGGQTILNFSSMLAITPITGIPLPFFSYGGSSLVMILVATGILANVAKRSNKLPKAKSPRYSRPSGSTSLFSRVRFIRWLRPTVFSNAKNK